MLVQRHVSDIPPGLTHLLWEGLPLVLGEWLDTQDVVPPTVEEQPARTDEDMTIIALVVEQLAIATQSDLHIAMLSRASWRPRVVVHVRAQVVLDIVVSREVSCALCAAAQWYQISTRSLYKRAFIEREEPTEREVPGWSLPECC